MSQVHDVVHCSRNEEIYPYLYIIIHSGGIRYIGGNFFIMKKKPYNRCLWTVIYYIYTVCITKRGLVTVWLFHYVWRMSVNTSTRMFNVNFWTSFSDVLKLLKIYWILWNDSKFQCFPFIFFTSVSKLSLRINWFHWFFNAPQRILLATFRTLVRVRFHAPPIAPQLSTK